MSLETAIAELTAAVKEQNELTREILSKAAAASSRSTASSSTTASSDDGDDKPKRTRASKSTEDKTDDKKAVTLDDVKPILSAWLNEFPKNGDEDHPETAARKAEFKKKLTELKAENLPAVKPEKLGDLKDWAEAMKTKGRLVNDADEGDGDDDMLG